MPVDAPPLAQETLVQSILFHSRTERSDDYVRILQGLQTYAIEKNDWHIRRVMEDLSTQGSVVSEGLDILGIASGALGRAAKGLKILDFGSRAAQTVTSSSKRVSDRTPLEFSLMRKSAKHETRHTQPDIAFA
jgi:hypothetical protein